MWRLAASPVSPQSSGEALEHGRMLLRSPNIRTHRCPDPLYECDADEINNWFVITLRIKTCTVDMLILWFDCIDRLVWLVHDWDGVNLYGKIVSSVEEILNDINVQSTQCIFEWIVDKWNNYFCKCEVRFGYEDLNGLIVRCELYEYEVNDCFSCCIELGIMNKYRIFDELLLNKKEVFFFVF